MQKIKWNKKVQRTHSANTGCGSDYWSTKDFHVHCSVRIHWAQGRIQHDSPCVMFKRHQWLWTEIFDVVDALMDGWTTLLLYLRSRSALLVFTSWAPTPQMSSKALQRRWNVASRSDSWTPPWASDPVQSRSASLHHHFTTNWHTASMAFRSQNTALSGSDNN